MTLRDDATSKAAPELPTNHATPVAAWHVEAHPVRLGVLSEEVINEIEAIDVRIRLGCAVWFCAEEGGVFDD